MKHKSTSRLAAMKAVTALGVVTMVLGGTAAHAQNVNSGVSIGPSEALNPPSTPAAPAAEHVFTNLDPLRAQLARYGVDLELDWTAEVMGNLSGGTRRASTYAGQIGFEADIDWSKLANIPGLSTHVVMVNRQGSQVGTLIGDNLNQVQEIYGAGGNVAVHLVYAYAEESLLDGRVDIAVGRMPLLNDFAANPLYCNFMNNSLCGNPKLLPSADIGISSYPDAVWGGRVRVRPTANSYIQLGVYEVNQELYSNAEYRSGFKFSLAGASGVEVPVEVAYEPTIGAQNMQGHYKLGFAYDTTTYPQYFNSLAQFQSGNRGTGKKTEYWALADQMIIRNGPGPTDGLILLAGYAHADPNLSDYADQIFGGLLDRAFWSKRPQDTIGLLVNYARVSGRLGREQEFDTAFGARLANGATGVQSHQTIIELNYDIHVAPGINFEPVFQYYFRPNAQTNIKDAALLGFKSHINF